jgi:hypothetical protein
MSQGNNHKRRKEAMSTKYTAEEKAKALSYLKAYRLNPGSKVYTQVLHVAKSGMSRTISLHIVHKGEVVRISHLVAKVAGYSLDRDRMGIKSHGCGMDMCFEAVYNLGRVLFPKGFKQSNGEIRNDGGYALRNESL